MLRPDPWHPRSPAAAELSATRHRGGAHSPGEIRRAIRLRGPWDLLGLMLPSLGPVRIVRDASTSDPRVFDPDTDTRHWRQGYALIEERLGLVLCRLRFLGVDGSCLDLQLTDQSNLLAWSKLLCCFRAPVPATVQSSTPVPRCPPGSGFHVERHDLNGFPTAVDGRAHAPTATSPA